jgi:hypothetical protein
MRFLQNAGQVLKYYIVGSVLGLARIPGYITRSGGRD